MEEYEFNGIINDVEKELRVEVEEQEMTYAIRVN